MVWTEARGFDSIWLTEHHFIDYGLSVSPAVLRDREPPGRMGVVPEVVAAFSHPRADRSRAPAAAAGVPGDGGAIRAGLVGALVAESVAFGSLDIVAARVDELRRLGVGEMLCWMNFGGLRQERVRRSMELFAREVMPRFR